MMKKDWEINKLGDVCEIARGGSPRPIKDYITTDEDGINWIKIGDTDPSGKYIYTTSEKIKPAGLKKSRYVEAGDFLLSNSMSFGRPYVLQTNGCIHDGWLVLKNYQKSLYLDFFYYLLLSPNVQKQFEIEAKGSTVRNLNTEIVSNINVSYPPLEEQKRIVKILDEKFAQLESLKANAQTNLQNAKDLFQSQLTKAFSNTTWEKKRLGDICSKIVDGTHNSPPNTKEGDYQYITAKNIKLSGIDLSDITYVTKEIHESIYSRCNPEKGDVLLIKDGATTGIAVVNELDYQFSMLSSVALLKFDRNILDSYCLAYLLNSDETYKRFRAKMEGAAITRLTLVKIKDFEIPLPPLSEQKRIVEELDALSEKVLQLQEIYTKQIANCDELKQSLLQKAFEGEL